MSYCHCWFQITVKIGTWFREMDCRREFRMHHAIWKGQTLPTYLGGFWYFVNILTSPKNWLSIQVEAKKKKKTCEKWCCPVWFRSRTSLVKLSLFGKYPQKTLSKKPLQSQSIIHCFFEWPDYKVCIFCACCFQHREKK